MFNVEIGENRDQDGWFAVVSYTLKAELLDYQIPKVLQLCLRYKSLPDLMDEVKKQAMFFSLWGFL